MKRFKPGKDRKDSLENTVPLDPPKPQNIEAEQDTPDEIKLETVEVSPLESAENQAKEYLDSLQRLKAEFDNFRKRTDKERRRLIDLHQASVVTEMLPTLDAFEAAFHGKAPSGDNPYLEGFELIFTGFKDALSKLGLERLNVLGDAFDPELSDAMTIVPSEIHEPNTVIQEVSAGYRFKDRIIRPAKVIVAAEVPVVTPSDEESDDDI